MKTTIEQIEEILSNPQPMDIEIQPDGSIKAVPKGTANNATPKVLTLKQVLGDSY